LGKEMTEQREGWLDDEYVRVYAEKDRARVAQLYAFETFLPGYEPWASWGFDVLCIAPDSRLYLVPWIPLDESFRKERYQTVDAFEEAIARLHEATSAYEHFQNEVHLVTPLVFGGDPAESPVMIDQNAHAEVCRFWNQTYARLKKETVR